VASAAGCSQWRIQDLPKGRGDHGERVEREPKRGSGADPPAGSRAPGGGGGQGAKLKAFCTFLCKKVAKSSGFRRKFATVSESCRHDQP